MNHIQSYMNASVPIHVITPRPRASSTSMMINHLFDSYKNGIKKKAYIKITGFQLPESEKSHSVKVSYSQGKIIKVSNILAYVGSRKGFKAGVKYATNTENKVWELVYSDKQHSSFVVALYNQISLFGEQKIIGEIEIKLGSFQSNRVTNHTFILRSPNRNSEPTRINLSVHLCEDGSKPFQSSESNILNYEYEIIHKK